MTPRTTSPTPFPVQHPEPNKAVEWSDYPRIPPGEYFAHCYWAEKYRDPQFRRWTCLLRWDVLSEDLQQIIAKCIPMWFSLGSGVSPRASRRGRYLPEWILANGAPPTKRNRLSPHVFTGRVARVEIGDTDVLFPYSVVKRIIRWETGLAHHSVSKSISQGRHPEGPQEARAP